MMHQHAVTNSVAERYQTPRLETLLSLRVPRRTPGKRLRVQVDDNIGLTLERREQDS